MKRLLPAIIIGCLFVIAYMIISSIIFVLGGQNMALVPYLDLPVRLPKIIIYYFSPPTVEDFSTELTERKAFLGLLAFVINVLLYSILAYIVLTVLSRRRKKVELTREVEPPPPPSFAS